MSYAIADFVRAFTPGAAFTWNDGTRLVVDVVTAGMMALPSGRIVACDPGDLYQPEECVPFARSVRPGDYPVRLSVVTLSRTGGTSDRRVACADIVFGPDAPATWEPALRPEEDPVILEPDEFFGYGVDGGLGCFADGGAVARLDEESGEAFYFNTLLPALGESRLSWATIPLPGTPPGTLAAFPSGFGDGFYASYWGMDATGGVVRLVTDFGLLTEPVVEEVSFPLREWAGRTLVHPRLRERRLEVQVGMLEDSGRTLLVTTTGRTVEPRLVNRGVTMQAQVSDRQREQAAFRFRLNDPAAPDAALQFRFVVGRRAC